MPFVSEKQRRYFHWAAKHGKGGITPSMVNEWESHTPKGEKLPEKSAGVKLASAFWSGLVDELRSIFHR